MDYNGAIAIETESESEEEEDSEEDSEEEEEQQNPDLLLDEEMMASGFYDRLMDNNNNNSSIKLSGKGKFDEEEEDVLSGVETDGLCCSICMEPWSSGNGDHQISCLPCGHVYGLSCIKKWLRQQRSAKKCPNCKKICALKDVRVLYAARLVGVDEKLQKQVRSLKGKCSSLEQKVARLDSDYCKKEVLSQEREADLHLKLKKLKEKNKHLEKLLEDRQRESQGSCNSNQNYPRRVITDIGSASQPCSRILKLQREFRVDGGRLFDIDASDQLMIVARRLNGMGGISILTKISLEAPNDREDIQLPANSKAVRALCVRPCSRLALVASLGKKLSVVSTESNNTVLSYDLPAPAWSCTWDIDSPHHVYTGLQDGKVMVFDMRQTRTSLESRTGLSCNPVHTMISVAPDSSLSSGTRTLLTASQIGICEWNIGCSEERSYLIPASENQGVCISLAHSGVDDIVASFRPKIEMSVSQPLPTPSTSCGVEGSHIFYKKIGTQSYQKTGSLLSQVDSIRLPKSTIINKQNHSPMFVSTNEATSDLVLHDMFKLAVVERIKTPANQIWDMRCTEIWNSCVLGCLSGDVVQLFT